MSIVDHLKDFIASIKNKDQYDYKKQLDLLLEEEYESNKNS